MNFEVALRLLQPLTAFEEGVLWDWARGEPPIDEREKSMREQFKRRLEEKLSKLATCGEKS